MSINNLLAQAGYTLLEPSVIKDTASNTPTSFIEYAKGAYILLFTVIIIAAIIMLVIHGLNYVLSDIPNIKFNARTKLISIAWGLGIALCSYILLKLINPDLIVINLF